LHTIDLSKKSNKNMLGRGLGGGGIDTNEQEQEFR
jgi:hypothetical protein